jgi:hypothetical protein
MWARSVPAKRSTGEGNKPVAAAMHRGFELVLGRHERAAADKWSRKNAGGFLRTCGDGAKSLWRKALGEFTVYGR